MFGSVRWRACDTAAPRILRRLEDRAAQSLATYGRHHCRTAAPRVSPSFVKDLEPRGPPELDVRPAPAIVRVFAASADHPRSFSNGGREYACSRRPNPSHAPTTSSGVSGSSRGPAAASRPPGLSTTRAGPAARALPRELRRQDWLRRAGAAAGARRARAATTPSGASVTGFPWHRQPHHGNRQRFRATRVPIQRALEFSASGRAARAGDDESIALDSRARLVLKRGAAVSPHVGDHECHAVRT